ncbi:MAG: hypothetical protein LBJ72_00585 [Dysgonamonadaceae bacterium]|nr:hypothetical protein [Dysgonamonadaceae bacterium]
MLLLLNFISEDFLNKRHLKKMDILSDIEKKQIQTEEIGAISTEDADTIAMELPPSPPMLLSEWPENTIGFEDFSPEQSGMDAFFHALETKSSVRIAFFGDSFIEGDIFCGDFRELLQQKYGGQGVGMVPMSSAVSGFRRSVSHHHHGWKDYSLVDTFRVAPLGISGHVFIPKGDDTWASFALPKQKEKSDSCTLACLFYTLQPGYESVINYNINQSESRAIPLKATGQVEKLDIGNNKINSIRFSFPDTTGLIAYGVSLEDTTGIIVDNFSIRGTAGTAFGKIPASVLERFNQLTGYDLIILEYGLNAMEAEKTGFKWYGNAMVKAIQYLQKCFPNTSFLLLSVSDRSMKKEGEYVSMPSVKSFVTSQRRACSDTGIVFWNLFQAMGGEGSMVDWANSNPPKANKDYTHLTFVGGRWLAKKLFETFEFENKRYNEKKEYFEQNPRKNSVHHAPVDSIRLFDVD